MKSNLVALVLGGLKMKSLLRFTKKKTTGSKYTPHQGEQECARRVRQGVKHG